MWARLIGALIVFGLLAFVIGGAMYTMSQLQERLVEGGVLTRSSSPLQGFRESVEGAVRTFTYYATIGIVGLVVVAVAVLTVKGFIASRRLLGIIPFRDLQRHLLILGPTGSGKTNTAKKAVAMAVSKGVKAVILDWKGEYVGFVENATIVRKINPWDVGGRSPKERAVLAVEILREVTRDIADVSSASAALLLRELVRLYERDVPKTSDVISSLERFYMSAMQERRLAEANMAAALLRRLTWLQIDEERSAENTIRSGQVVVYDLSQLGSAYLKTIYSLAILSKTYYDALSQGPMHGLRQLLIAEECQNYVRGRGPDEPPSIGERTVNELRSYGVGVVMISPDPTQIPWHLARDVSAVVAIGVQAMPDFFREVFRAYDYTRLRKIIHGEKTYVYRRGRIQLARAPKRPPKQIRLAYTPPPPVEEITVEAGKPEVVETMALRVEKPVAEGVSNVVSVEEPRVEESSSEAPRGCSVAPPVSFSRPDWGGGSPPPGEPWRRLLS